MSNPIVYISHNRVKPGKLDDFGRMYREAVKTFEANKPGTLVHISYANEDHTEVTIIHLFPDADAFDRHLQGVSENAKRAFEFIESDRLELDGTPNPGVVELIRRVASPGAVLSVYPQHLGGYIRMKAG